jgi:hypothetical protein
MTVEVYICCEPDGVGVDVELSGERDSLKGCGASVRARFARGRLSAVDERTNGALAMSACGNFFWSLGFSHFGPGSLTQPSSTWQTLSGSPEVLHLWQDGLLLEQTCLIFAQYSHGFGVT